MMMRPRLTRPAFLSLVAIAAIVFLSYFPVAHTRASNVSASILPSVSKPLVNLKSTQSVKLTYSGDSGAVSALRSGAAAPVSMASGDFNADGAIDVVAGYSTPNGGALAVMMGNPNAYAPTDATLYKKALNGSVPATFQAKAATFSLPESPDLIVTGDFNRDGRKDVLVAARGSNNLYLLPGDGTGNLLAPQTIPLLGQVHALAATNDGYLAVSLEGPSGSELTILAPGKEGLSPLATYSLPARGDSVAWGSLGGSADVAVGAGSNVVLVYNALKASAQSETVAVPFQVRGLVLGNFIWDRDDRTEISLLADDGSIHILQHGTLNTTPLTAADLPARRAAIRGRHAKSAIPSNPTALGQWTLAQQLPYTGSAPSGPVSSAAFNSPRLASAATHDLMVLDSAASQLHILDTSGQKASASADVSFSSAPVAALALSQKLNSDRDIVVLTSGQAAPLLVTSGASVTLNVNSTTDSDSTGLCTSNSTSTPATLTLRAAVCLANNLGAGGDTVTINVPAGTYSLTGLDTGELQQGVTGTGDAVSYSLTINGTGTASDTIIQGNTSGDRILEEDLDLVGNNPVTIENLTLQNATCSNNSTEDCTDGGGAVIAGGVTGDDLTLTNVVMHNNQANPSDGSSGGGQDNGGAVSFESPSDLTITNSTFSNNVASGAGGAVNFLNNGTGQATVTGSTFSSNTSGENAGANAVGTEGGGFDMEVEAGETTGSVSGSTFTGNNALGLGGGGGLFIGGDGGTFSVSGSRFTGNIASAAGGGVSVEDSVDATLTENWWGCNGGPGASGCDTVNVEAGSSGNFNPWLVLKISAGSTQINTNSSTGLTATIDSDSNGGSGTSVPNGTPISFGATLGTISGASSTLTSGSASATYNSGSTPGAGSGTATVDNQEVSVTINILVSVTVTTSPANLSITVDGVTATAPQTYSWVVGSSHTIATTSPQNVSGGSEQVFSSWSDGGALSHSVTAPSSATTYTASFNTEYQLTTQASPAGDGTVTPTSGQYFASGASVPVTATPNTDFAFNNWTSTGGSFGSTTSASTTFTMPAAATTITANFIPATSQITITTNPAGLLVSVDGGGFVAAPLVVTWNQGSTHTIATTSPQSGGAGTQYAFTSWSDAGAISHSITVPTTATTYTASFAT
jgi:Divergent InlB B-repeat domain